MRYIGKNICFYPSKMRGIIWTFICKGQLLFLSLSSFLFNTLALLEKHEPNHINLAKCMHTFWNRVNTNRNFPLYCISKIAMGQCSGEDKYAKRKPCHNLQMSHRTFSLPRAIPSLGNLCMGQLSCTFFKYKH